MRANGPLILAVMSGLTAGLFQAGMTLLFGQKLGIQSSSILITTTVFLLSSYYGTVLFRRIHRHTIHIYVGCLLSAGLISFNPTLMLQFWTDSNPFVSQTLAALSIGLFPAITAICFLPVTLGILNQNISKRKVRALYATDLISTGAGWALAYLLIIPKFGLDALFHLLACVFIIFAMTLWRCHKVLDPASDTQNNTEPSTPTLAASVYYLAFFSGLSFFANETAWLNLWKIVIGSSILTQPIILSTIFLAMGVGIIIWGERGQRGDWLDKLIRIHLFSGVYILILVISMPQIASELINIKNISPIYISKSTFQITITLALLSFPFACSALLFSSLLARHPNSQSLLRILGLNTLGSVIGLWAASQIEISLLGSVNSLFLNSAILAVILYLASLRSRKNKIFLTMTLIVSSLGSVTYESWQWTKIWNGGANYFHLALPKWETLVSQTESFESGFVTIMGRDSQNFLLINGIFQGNDAAEVIDQFGFSIAPHFFVKEPKYALNIGLGVGGTASALAHLPYEMLDVIEVAPQVISYCKNFFPHLNKILFTNPKVNLVVDDGRRFLDRNISKKKYSIITIEANNMWIGGAQNLYSHEFYQLAKKRLIPGGVFQQWLQLHHTSPETLAVTMRTLKESFKYVQVWIPNRQGVIIASDSPLVIQPDRIAEARQLSDLPSKSLDHILLGAFLLDEDVTCFLNSKTSGTNLQLSTDSNQRLAYVGYHEVSKMWNIEENIITIQKAVAESCPERSVSQPDRWRQVHPEILGW